MATKCPACGQSADLTLLSTHRDMASNEHGYRLTPVATYRCPCGATWAETSLVRDRLEISRQSERQSGEPTISSQ